MSVHFDSWIGEERHGSSIKTDAEEMRTKAQDEIRSRIAKRVFEILTDTPHKSLTSSYSEKIIKIPDILATEEFIQRCNDKVLNLF